MGTSDVIMEQTGLTPEQLREKLHEQARERSTPLSKIRAIADLAGNEDAYVLRRLAEDPGMTDERARNEYRFSQGTRT